MKISNFLKEIGTATLIGLAVAGCASSGIRSAQTSSQNLPPSERSQNYPNVVRKEAEILGKIRQTGSFAPGADIYFACAVANSYQHGDFSIRDRRGMQECLKERGYQSRRR